MARVIVKKITICDSEGDELTMSGNEYSVEFLASGKSNKLQLKVSFDVNSYTGPFKVSFNATMGKLPEYTFVDNEDGVINYGSKDLDIEREIMLPFQIKLVNTNTDKSSPINVEAKVQGSPAHDNDVWFKKSE